MLLVSCVDEGNTNKEILSYLFAAQRFSDIHLFAGIYLHSSRLLDAATGVAKNLHIDGTHNALTPTSLVPVLTPSLSKEQHCVSTLESLCP